MTRFNTRYKLPTPFEYYSRLLKVTPGVLCKDVDEESIRAETEVLFCEENELRPPNATKNLEWDSLIVLHV